MALDPETFFSKVIHGIPWRPQFDPWVQKNSWRRKWPPTPVLLPAKSHGQRSLKGCSPWGHKESDKTERLHFHFHMLNSTGICLLSSIISNSVVLCSAGTSLSKTDLLFYFFFIKQLWLMQSNTLVFVYNISFRNSEPTMYMFTFFSLTVFSYKQL